MGANTLISVIVPARNAEATIERALDSLTNQTHRDLEILVIDDGSTDRTGEIVAFLARRDPRIRLIQQDQAGPGSARNTGMDAATGTWVAFLDADDEYAPEAFERILSRIDGLEVGLVIFSIKFLRAYIYARPIKLDPLQDGYFAASGERADAFIAEYLRKERMLIYSQSNKLYKRSTIEKHHLRCSEEVSFGEDRIFNYAYLRHAGSVLTMSDQLLTYHYGLPSGLSNMTSSSGFRDFVELSNAKVELFNDYGYTPRDLQRIRQREARNILNETIQWLIGLDRTHGSAGVRVGARKVLSGRPERCLLAPRAAGSRRAKVMQLAMRTRLVWVVTIAAQHLRIREDRIRLRARSRPAVLAKGYASLGIDQASTRVKKRYLLLPDYELFLDRINPEQSRNVLRDKTTLLRRLSAAQSHDFLNRAWIDLRLCTFDEFRAFVQREETFVAKLFNGRISLGTEVVNFPSSRETDDELYERLVLEKKYILEGYLTQHPEVNRIYGKALASVRIHTLKLGDDVQVVLPAHVKFGSRDSTTSNSWGINCLVDLNSETICSDGLFRGKKYQLDDEVLAHHPDTQIAFLSAATPGVLEGAELVMAAARLVPEVPFVGWDVALTASGPAIIEGNAASLSYGILQILLTRFRGIRGMRKDYMALLSRHSKYVRAIKITERKLTQKEESGQLD